MDLATLVFVTVCGGHCKQVTGVTEFFGMPTLAECRAEVGKSGAKLLVKSDKADYLAEYKICVGASPQVVRWGRRSPFDEPWWRSKLVKAATGDSR